VAVQRISHLGPQGVPGAQAARQDVERVDGFRDGLDGLVNQVAHQVVVVRLGNAHHAHLALREG